jgi:hypothetical protein
MKKLAVAIFLLASGCATPTTGVVPLGEGMYTVTRQGAGAWVPTAELKAAALIEANQYCESKQRSFKVINVKEIPAGPFGRWPEAEVLFACP